MLYNESKDNKSKEYRDRKANTRICYRGSAKCLRPRSKFDDLEIPLFGLLFTNGSQPLPYNGLLFTLGANLSLTQTDCFCSGANLTTYNSDCFSKGANLTTTTRIVFTRVPTSPHKHL